MLKRIITGSILLVLTLGLLGYLPYRGFSVAVTLIFTYAAWEWANFIPMAGYRSRTLYVCLILLAMYVTKQFPLYFILILSFIWWLFALMSLVVYSKHEKWLSSLWTHALLGVVILVPCWLALNTIRFAQNGVKTLLFLLCIIWAADTGAYFTGKWFGKHKLIPKVSPNKTWEGLYGGILLSVLVTVLGCILFDIDPPHWPLVIAIGFLTALFSVVGDLFESLLKRQVGIKDSGKIFPGHGGLLDRIDSLLAAAPIFLLGCLWLKMHF